jgi:hypothetical protein
MNVLFVLLFLIGCSDNSNVLTSYEKNYYKQIAYNSLSPNEKSTIMNPDNAVIIDGIYKYENRSHKIYIDKEHIIYFGLIDTNIVLIDNQKLISILFNTTQDALLGPIDVIINPFSKQTIGQTLRF